METPSRWEEAKGMGVPEGKGNGAVLTGVWRHIGARS